MFFRNVQFGLLMQLEVVFGLADFLFQLRARASALLEVAQFILESVDFFQFVGF